MQEIYPQRFKKRLKTNYLKPINIPAENLLTKFRQQEKKGNNYRWIQNSRTYKGTKMGKTKRKGLEWG